MKRVGNLMPRIVAMENLHEAFLRAARGKSGKAAVIDFRNHLDERLSLIQEHLSDGTFRFGQYHFFTINDPKERTICAASFPERVVFHAMMRICHPVFENYQTNDSYASRIGRGTYKALDRARFFASRYEWFAKIDVCKYFDSINHKVLLGQLSRLFKDSMLLIYFRDLLDTYSVNDGNGLPIGNLTSQYFANHYLSVADHYIKESVRVPAMVRYMDDVLIFSHTKTELLGWVKRYYDYLNSALLLKVHEPVINQSRFGVPFLGYVVYGKHLRLNRRSKERFETKMSKLNTALAHDEITETEYANRATCMMAFVNKADAAGFRRLMMEKKGVYPQGL